MWRSTCKLPVGCRPPSRCLENHSREPLRVDRPAELRRRTRDRGRRTPDPAKSRSSSCVSRCARSVSTVTGSSATVRRDRADFGGPNVAPPRVGTSCCSTDSRAPSRSSVRHVRPASSPRRIPVVAASRQSAASRSSATCSRNRRSSPAVHACARLRPRRDSRRSEASAIRTERLGPAAGGAAMPEGWIRRWARPGRRWPRAFERDARTVVRSLNGGDRSGATGFTTAWGVPAGRR